MIGAARAQFPWHVFRLHSASKGHGRHVCFSWTLAPQGGSAVAGGADVVRLDGQGCIAEVVGFLDGGAA